jgi:hypothetical protein
MTLKFRTDKHNGFYATVNGKRFTGKTKEIILEKIRDAGKISDIIPTSKLTVKDAFESFLPYIKLNKAESTYYFIYTILIIIFTASKEIRIKRYYLNNHLK